MQVVSATILDDIINAQLENADAEDSWPIAESKLNNFPKASWEKLFNIYELVSFHAAVLSSIMSLTTDSQQSSECSVEEDSGDISPTERDRRIALASEECLNKKTKVNIDAEPWDDCMGE